MGYGKDKAMAYVGTENRGSSLVGECGEGHENQPKGKSIGTGQKSANIRGGDDQIFGKVGSKTPATFNVPGQVKSGKLRLSGVKGAHRLGSRGK